jgi:hypothetical protein
MLIPYVQVDRSPPGMYTELGQFVFVHLVRLKIVLSINEYNKQQSISSQIQFAIIRLKRPFALLKNEYTYRREDVNYMNEL